MNPLPRTPEDAVEEARAARRAAYKEYRRHTRPFRRTFRGIISRREAERFVIARMKKQARAAIAAGLAATNEEQS